MLSKSNEAIIDKINLSQKTELYMSSLVRSNDCEILIILKGNQHHQITFPICSSGYYNSSITAKQHLKLTIKGSRPQLKHTLISIMVT